MTKAEFVVTEHHAKRARLHWDLRFEMPKSKLWASFAVRKGIPMDMGKKVLAVRTHNHTRDEALMTGDLESGYGAGKLIEWDRGKCEIHKYSPSHIAINFKGKKMKGLYHLINTGVMRSKQKYKDQQYLLFKGRLMEEGATGMVSRIPTCGQYSDTEENEEDLTTKKLPWSLAEYLEALTM